jgi:hypothetical protein
MYWFNTSLGWPVVFESCALGEMLLDLFQGDNPARLGGEQLISDPLNFATKFEIGLKMN